MPFGRSTTAGRRYEPSSPTMPVVFLAVASAGTGMVPSTAQAQVPPAAGIGPESAFPLAVSIILPALLATAVYSGLRRRQAERRERDILALLERARESETALREREKRLRTVMNATDEAIWDLDLERNELWWNDGVRSVFGHSWDDAGRDPDARFSRIHPDDRDRITAAQAQLASGRRERWSDEYRLQKEDGSYALVHDRCRVMFDEGGKPVRIIGAMLDITEQKEEEERRKRLEERVRQAQKLESLGVLAGGVAHDFNNILMAMLGYTDIALSELPRDSAARRPLDEVVKAARRGSELTDQMLAYAGRTTTNPEPVRISQLARDMADLVRSAVSKKAQLRQDLPDDLPLVVADAGQIRQVIINLITNASDALDEDSGTIAIAAGVVPGKAIDQNRVVGVRRLDHDRYVYLIVSDTGRGMDQDTRSKIFEPFYTTKFAGRGLGLAAVLGIVRSHDGEIAVDSTPGDGTSVTVYLPAADATHPTDRPLEEPGPHSEWTGTATVLVADDEEPVRSVIAMRLRRGGFSVVEAVNGQDAIDRFHHHRAKIDLALLDLTMPEMGGDEAMREIREMAPDLPIIIASGYAEDDAVLRFTQEERVHFMHKPFDLAALIHKVQTLLPATERPTDA